jgi:hypothetical protein
LLCKENELSTQEMDHDQEGIFRALRPLLIELVSGNTNKPCLMEMIAKRREKNAHLTYNLFLSGGFGVGGDPPVSKQLRQQFIELLAKQEQACLNK